MSTNKEFFDYVMTIVNRSNDPVSRAFAVSVMPKVLQNLNNTPLHPWFLETEGPVTLVENVDNADLPADFFDFVEDSEVFLIDSAGKKTRMYRDYFEDMQSRSANADPGEPSTYDIIGTKIYVEPTPAAQYTLRFWYLKKTLSPQDNDNQVSNEWIVNAEDYVAHLVAERVARYKLRNKEMADDLAETAAGFRAELFKANEARKHSNMEYTINR